jgi:hypothetical protein
MFSATLSVLLQFALLSFAVAEETVVATTHGNSWQYGAGGGVLGFIVLILDIIVFSRFSLLESSNHELMWSAVEVLKSNRPVPHKLLWCVVVFLFPILGLVIYYLFSERTAHMGSGGAYEAIP